MKQYLYVLAALFFCISACNLKQEQQTNEAIKNSTTPDQMGTDVDITYSEEGQIKVKLKAPTLIMKDNNTEQYNEFPDGLVMTFYNKEGEKNADLYANYGFDDVRARERYVKDSVRIVTTEGAVYTTNELYIDEKKDSVHNNGKYVKITDTDGTLVQGEGFVANTRMEKIRILKTLPSQVPIESTEQGQTILD